MTWLIVLVPVAYGIGMLWLLHRPGGREVVRRRPLLWLAADVSRTVAAAMLGTVAPMRSAIHAAVEFEKAVLRVQAATAASFADARRGLREALREDVRSGSFEQALDRAETRLRSGPRP